MYKESERVISDYSENLVKIKKDVPEEDKEKVCFIDNFLVPTNRKSVRP